jgi:hypothetical protein
VHIILISAREGLLQGKFFNGALVCQSPVDIRVFAQIVAAINSCGLL